MDLNHFVAIISADTPPERTDFERVVVFAETADKTALWDALGRSGIHPVYRTLVVQALHRRILEELALERRHEVQRKREEAIRTEAARSEETRVEAAMQQTHPPRKRGR